MVLFQKDSASSYSYIQYGHYRYVRIGTTDTVYTSTTRNAGSLGVFAALASRNCRSASPINNQESSRIHQEFYFHREKKESIKSVQFHSPPPLSPQSNQSTSAQQHPRINQSRQSVSQPSAKSQPITNVATL